jgi:Deoxyribodipyrimidine photolyase
MPGPGEASAHRRLEHVVEHELADYHRRDEPAVEATSRLSPHLRFGELSPVQLWHRLHGDLTRRHAATPPRSSGSWAGASSTGTSCSTRPELATKNVRAEFDAFPWSTPSPDDLTAWQRGAPASPWWMPACANSGRPATCTTGAHGHRELLDQEPAHRLEVGERWFWDTLVDADEASNPGNWQWVAGSGADAAPYFRVFNPELQAAKFDPRGEYLDRWVPERLGLGYPDPIVDLARSRRDALTAYEHVTVARASLARRPSSSRARS